MKKKRMVVGPPPIKYLKKYTSGGDLNYDNQGNLVRNKTYSTKDEMPVVSSKKNYGKDVTSLGDSIGLGKTNYNVNVPKKSSTPSYSGNSFGEAFAKARKELGANKVFSYNGKLFTTNYANTESKKSTDSSNVKKGGPVDGANVVGRMNSKNNNTRSNEQTYTVNLPEYTITEKPTQRQQLKQNGYWPIQKQTGQQQTESGFNKQLKKDNYWPFPISPNSKPQETTKPKEKYNQDKFNFKEAVIETILGPAAGYAYNSRNKTTEDFIDDAVTAASIAATIYGGGVGGKAVSKGLTTAGNAVKNKIIRNQVARVLSKNPKESISATDRFFKTPSVQSSITQGTRKIGKIAQTKIPKVFDNIKTGWRTSKGSLAKIPKKADGGTLNTAADITSSLGGLASMIPGIGGVIGGVVSGIATPIMKSIAQGQAQRSNTNKMYSSTQMLEKGGMIKKKIDKYAYGGNVYQPTIWGYPVYKSPENFSKEKSFNSAFEKARGKNLDKFLYNGKTYNTRKDTDDIKLTPEVIKMYGDVNKILNKEYPELKKLLNRGTPVNKLQYIKDRASWLPSGINVGKTRLGKDEDPTSMLNIFNLPAELAHHEQFTNLPIVKRMLKFASGIKERFKYGDPGMYYKKGTIENEAHSQWEPAIELTARGNLTPEYIKQVQRKLGFTGKDVDGILGPKTYGKLVSAAGLSKKVLDNPEGRGDMEEGTDVLPKILKTMQNMVDMGSLQKTTSNETFIPKKEKGGLIKRKDGSYSKRGLWDNIRANKGSGRKPTSEMLKQERKIKKMSSGGTLSGRDDLTMYKGRLHRNGGIMVSSKGTPTKNNPSAEVEHNETRFSKGDSVYIFSDKLLI